MEKLPVAVLPLAGYVRIITAFRADGGLTAVTGIDNSIIRQHHEPGMNAVYQLTAAASRHQGGVDAAPEEIISGEYLAGGKQADAPGRMPRGMEHFKAYTADFYFIAFAQQPVRRVGGLIGYAELRTERAATFQEIGIVDVNGDLGAGPVLDIV